MTLRERWIIRDNSLDTAIRSPHYAGSICENTNYVRPVELCTQLELLFQ